MSNRHPPQLLLRSSIVKHVFIIAFYTRFVFRFNKCRNTPRVPVLCFHYTTRWPWWTSKARLAQRPDGRLVTGHAAWGSLFFCFPHLSFSSYFRILRFLPFLKHADIRKQYDMLANTYNPSMAINTVGSEYWKTAPVGHLYVMKNTKISIGTTHTIKLFVYHALACNQLSSPISIMASWKKKTTDLRFFLKSKRYKITLRITYPKNRNWFYCDFCVCSFSFLPVNKFSTSNITEVFTHVESFYYERTMLFSWLLL